MKRLQARFGGLDATVLEPGGEAGGPRWSVVLCHGYGAPGEDLVPIGHELLGVAPDLRARVRFVFPAAPLTLAQLGAFGGRAWWHLDLERLMTSRDRSYFLEEVPEGLARARRLLAALVEELCRATGSAPGRVILGGFSQGAMLATDLALRMEEPPAGLVVLSGSVIAREEWTRRAPSRAGLPVFQTHGRYDDILPFAPAEQLRALLEGAGLAVEFHPFDGPHTVDEGALEKLADWLERRTAGP